MYRSLISLIIVGFFVSCSSTVPVKVQNTFQQKEKESQIKIRKDKVKCFVEDKDIRGIYYGECKNGKAHGFGKSYGKDKYIGYFKQGKLHGKGTYRWISGNVYDGDWQNGKRNGKGSLKFNDGAKYVGEFKNSKINGQGTFMYSGGEKYVGELKNGKRNGQGTFTYNNGKKHVGEFKNGIIINSKISVSKTSHSSLGSGKSYCQSKGGDWTWNGKVNEWECKGADISSFYKQKAMMASEKEKMLLKEKILKAEQEKKQIAKIKKCLKSNIVKYTRDDELNLVIDQCRNLMWKDNYGNKILHSWSETWENAQKSCNESKFGGYSNWRLPTVNELKSIIDTKRRPAIKEIFKGAKLTSLKHPLFYWSSDSSGSGIDFRNGKVSFTSTGRVGIVSQSRLYRCVRNMPNNDKIYKDQQYRKKTVIGSKNFKNVKLINGVLWEDQASNRNRNETYNSCKQYCQSLNLLGVNQWQVPTREQYNQIRYKGYKKLDNIGKGKSFGMYFTPFQYFTKNECTYHYYGDKHPGAYGIELGSGYNCVRKDSYAADNSRGCRCSLDVDIYNQSKNTKLNHLEKKTTIKDFNFYINKFNLTDDVNVLKKAEKLAKTKLEKAKVEKAYISFIGDYRKVFKLDTSSIAGKTKRDADLDILFVKDLSKSKKIRYKIKLSKNSKSPIPLKYGSYKINVDFTLGLSYTTGYKFGDTTIAQGRSKEYHRTMTFNLNSQNGYSDYQTLDFGKFMVASSGSLSFIGIQSQISSAVLKSKITEVKLK